MPNCAFQCSQAIQNAKVAQGVLKCYCINRNARCFQAFTAFHVWIIKAARPPAFRTDIVFVNGVSEFHSVPPVFLSRPGWRCYAYLPHSGHLLPAHSPSQPQLEQVNRSNQRRNLTIMRPLPGG